MKKLFIAALITATFVTGAFAKDNNKISSVVLNQFKVEFKDASNVVWSKTNAYAKATFTVNDKKMEAFYNRNGEVIASSTSVSVDQLPVNAKRIFAKKYEGYAVKEVIRFEGTDETAYYISAENEKEFVIVKISENGDVSIFERTSK